MSIKNLTNVESWTLNVSCGIYKVSFDVPGPQCFVREGGALMIRASLLGLDSNRKYGPSMFRADLMAWTLQKIRSIAFEAPSPELLRRVRE